MKKLIILLSIILTLFFVQGALAESQCSKGGINYSSNYTVNVEGAGNGLIKCNPGDVIIKIRGDNGPHDRRIASFDCAKATNPSGTNPLLDSSKTTFESIPGRGNWACGLDSALTGFYFLTTPSYSNNHAMAMHCTELKPANDFKYDTGLHFIRPFPAPSTFTV